MSRRTWPRGALCQQRRHLPLRDRPDGCDYALGGEVAIDTSAIAGDPEATLRKMEQIRRAALAPANPSGQDRMGPRRPRAPPPRRAAPASA
jgi:hypothetical protein